MKSRNSAPSWSNITCRGIKLPAPGTLYRFLFPLEYFTQAAHVLPLYPLEHLPGHPTSPAPDYSCLFP